MVRSVFRLVPSLLIRHLWCRKDHAADPVFPPVGWARLLSAKGIVDVRFRTIVSFHGCGSFVAVVMNSMAGSSIRASESDQESHGLRSLLGEVSVVCPFSNGMER